MPRRRQNPRYQQVISVLVSARQHNKLSQSKLALLLGKPQQFVSRYEHGERRLDVIEYVDAASALGLDAIGELARIITGSRTIGVGDTA